PFSPAIIVHCEKASDVGEAVLFRRHRAAVGEAEHLACDLARCPAVLSRLTLLDEPGVFGETAGVEKQRLAIAIAERTGAAEVLERHRLAAAGVVGHGHH